ncbi:hypothetical protein GCM10010363_60590 [Streptomyces omiyaensis]|uniref:hypothetical protein n=1 Tax=Streptomyces omiyaensis TaxID=68247 RepID=UPI001675C25C|nr:hypothetical protein [Streptomyces omiyaensis]GGY71245.1 hypothetical protein GCM10010363_60590 [Streptomyces omiyaensis]
MTPIPPPLPVQGRTVPAPTGPLLLLDTRLEGHDTFLTGTLTLAGYDLAVRILTLDDSTTLQPVHPLPTNIPAQWTAALHLRHGQRDRRIPDDLHTAAHTARRDLTALDDAERRYALTFLGEATTLAIRADRVDVIVRSLPALDEGDRT